MLLACMAFIPERLYLGVWQQGRLDCPALHISSRYSRKHGSQQHKPEASSASAWTVLLFSRFAQQIK